MRFASVFALLLFPVAAQAAEPITGSWVTQNKKAVVTIRPCGSKMCGNITKLLPAADFGKTVDERNSNAKLRTRPLLGLPLFIDLKDKGSDWRGDLYSPQEGLTFSTTVSRNADGTLKVRGCYFIICKTQTWQPAE